MLRVVAFILTLAGGIVAGVAGIHFTARLFDSMNWCCFHSWAQMHGTFPVEFLFWACLWYLFIWRFWKFWRRSLHGDDPEPGPGD